MLGASSEDHVQVDPAESLMREVGAQLRERRLERGEDLDEVAQYLRIKPAYLFGIEQGDLSLLPGRPYALGFLRSYADYLGFDGNDLVARIKATVEGLTDRTRLRMRTPLPENRLPKAPVVVLSLAVVAGIYAGWSYANRSSRVALDPVAEVPSDLGEHAAEAGPAQAVPVEGAAAPEPASDAAAGSLKSSESSERAASDRSGTSAATDPLDRPVTPEAGASGQESSALAPTGAPEGLPVQAAAAGTPTEPVGAEAPSASQAVADPEPAPADGRTPAPADGAAGNPENPATATDVLALLDPVAGSPDEPEVYERANEDARVILRARERAWVEVSSPAGDYTFTRTLEPGDALLVPNRADLELWTGNAGGLEIVVDGTPVTLARAGAVQRHISLDPERLLAAPAAQP